MLRLAKYHLSRLEAAKADPAILVLYNLFLPAVQLYHDMLSSLVSSENTSVGNTAKWMKLLDEMADTWYDKWQVMVFTVFARKSPEAIAIFPRNKEPFQSSQYDERMVAVEALHKSLLKYPELKDAAADVAAKLELLNEARQEQTTEFGRKEFTASMIEDQRLVLANLMDDNLCQLKVKYRSNIKMVENYFDLTELRKASTDSDARFAANGAVEAGATSAVAVPDKLVLGANTACSFMNKSNSNELQFFFSANASAADSPNKASVLANESLDTTAAEVGWAPGMRYLIVKNPGTVTAEFELMVVEAVV
jgi:hypothetical protein